MSAARVSGARSGPLFIDYFCARRDWHRGPEPSASEGRTWTSAATVPAARRAARVGTGTAVDTVEAYTIHGELLQEARSESMPFINRILHVYDAKDPILQGRAHQTVANL